MNNASGVGAECAAGMPESISIEKMMKKDEVLPRFELGSPDSESEVLTITP